MYICNGMVGRYVNVYVPGDNKYVNLCEVEVTGSAVGNYHPPLLQKLNK